MGLYTETNAEGYLGFTQYLDSTAGVAARKSVRSLACLNLVPQIIGSALSHINLVGRGDYPARLTAFQIPTAK